MVVTSITTLEQYTDIVYNNPECKKHIVIDFYAEWCSPCKRYAPTYKKLSDKYGKYISFLKVDVDTDNIARLVDNFKIQNLPTFIIIDRNKIDHNNKLEVLIYTMIEGVTQDSTDKLETVLKDTHELCDKYNSDYPIDYDSDF